MAGAGRYRNLAARDEGTEYQSELTLLARQME